jgi:hypothetical protein
MLISARSPFSQFLRHTIGIGDILKVPLPGQVPLLQFPIMSPFVSVPCRASVSGSGPGDEMVIVNLPVMFVKVPVSETLCVPRHGSGVVKVKFVTFRLLPLPCANVAVNVTLVVPSGLVNVALQAPLIWPLRLPDELPPHPGRIKPNTSTLASTNCFIVLLLQKGSCFRDSNRTCLGWSSRRVPSKTENPENPPGVPRQCVRRGGAQLLKVALAIDAHLMNGAGL